MDRETWTRNNHRPQFVREYREEILEATSDAVAHAMPDPDASTFEYRQFLNDHADQVTAELASIDGDECTVDVDGEECGRDLPCQYHGLESVEFNEVSA